MSSKPQQSSGEELFRRLDKDLVSIVGRDREARDYFEDPRDFRSLHQVVNILRDVQMDNEIAVGDDLTMAFHENSTYVALQDKLQRVSGIIEDVVTFQHGGLNNSVDTMSEVMQSYSKGREEIHKLKESIRDTREVLLSKKSGLKELWMSKCELDQTLSILKDIEFIKDAPLKVNRYMQQRRYLSAVTTLNTAIQLMFSENLIAVAGLNMLREQLLELKETILENIVTELREAVHGLAEVHAAQRGRRGRGGTEGEDSDDSDSDKETDLMDTFSEARSESYTGGSHALKSVYEPTIYSESPNGPSVTVDISGNGGGDSGWNNFDIHVAVNELSKLISIDDKLEMNMLDPSTSGQLFVQLLIRAIGGLGTEEDVERMLFDHHAQVFAQIVREMRTTVAKKLEKRTNKLRKAFSGETPGQIEGDVDLLGEREDDLQMRMFSDYVSKLLDLIHISLRKLLYVLRLLCFSRHFRHQGLEGAHEYVMKESIRQNVLQWLDDIEGIVIGELKLHFVESGVAEISDTLNARNSDLKRQIRSAIDDDDGEDFDISKADPIFIPTARFAAPVFKRITVYGYRVKVVLVEAQVLQGGAVTSSDLTANSKGGKPPLPKSMKGRGAAQVSQSAQPTKPIFDIDSVAYTNRVVEMVQTHLEMELIPVVQSDTNAVIRELQMNVALFSVFTGIQNRSRSQSLKIAAAAQQGHGGHTQAQGKGKGAPASVILCEAARVSFRAAKPLYATWMQLAEPEHRNMVETILERLLTGLSTSAREEIGNLTWRLLSSSDPYRKNIVKGMQKDVLFKVYRRYAYGGKGTIEDYIGDRADTESMPNRPKNASGSSFESNTSGDDNALSRNAKRNLEGDDNVDSNAANAQALDAELEAWGPLWDVGSTKYPVSIDLILRDMSSLSTVAAVSHGCDWLIHQMLRSCSIMMRKDTAEVVAASANSKASGQKRRPSMRNKPFLADLHKSHSTMWAAVQRGCQGLAKASEEALGMVRSEVQVICFLHLHQLAHVRGVRTDSAVMMRGRRFSDAMQLTNSATADQDAYADEADHIVDDLAQYLQDVFAALRDALSSQAIAVVFSPLCSLIPRILIRCTRAVIAQTEVKHDSSRLLRNVVSSQLALSVLFESMQLDPVTMRQLQDRLTDEFERARRFVTLLDVSCDELKSYMKNNLSEYSSDEYESLWNHLPLRETHGISFANVYRSLRSKSVNFNR